jgi:hypothetical protein
MGCQRRAVTVQRNVDPGFLQTQAAAHTEYEAVVDAGSGTHEEQPRIQSKTGFTTQVRSEQAVLQRGVSRDEQR